MRGGKEHAAAGQMRPHQLGQPCLRRNIECGGRLIEQPEPARNREQPRDRETPPLARREIGGREIGKFVEPDGGKRALKGSGRPAQKLGPEFQVFADGQR